MRRENDKRRKHKKAKQLHRIWKTAVGVTLVSALILSGIGTDAGLHLPQAAAAEQTAKLSSVYLNGSGSGGDGATAETAVTSFSKASSLAADGGVILVSGTVTVSEDTELSMPSGITVKKADGFAGPVVRVTGKGKLRISYGWLSASDVDTSSADLGKDAFVIGEAPKTEPEEAAKEEPKEENKTEEKPEEKPEETKPAEKQQPQEITVPGSLSMAEPGALSGLDMSEGFGGDGTFRFAEPDTVPSAYESSQQVIFTPNDCENYDYTQVEGWSEIGQEVVRYVTVYVESLKEPEVPQEPEEEPQKPEESQEPELQPETEEQPPVAEEGTAETTPAETKPEEGAAEKPETEKPDEQQPVKEDGQKTESTENKEKPENVTDKEISGKEAADKETAVKAETPKKEAEEPVGHLYDGESGIEISGDFIPSYVEIRVSRNEGTEDILSEEIEKILNSYNIELWDLKSDSKYKIPEGRKVTVKIPVPEDADLYESLIIAHYMPEKGTYEYFVPGQNMVIKNGYLVFETDSFSPFNVGGNQLVGIGTESQNHKPSSGTGTITGGSGRGNSGQTAGSGSSLVIKRPVITSASNSGSSRTAANPRTGDESPVLAYVLIAGAAVLLIIVLLVIGKRKKK